MKGKTIKLVVVGVIFATALSFTWGWSQVKAQEQANTSKISQLKDDLSALNSFAEEVHALRVSLLGGEEEVLGGGRELYKHSVEFGGGVYFGQNQYYDANGDLTHDILPASAYTYSLGSYDYPLLDVYVSGTVFAATSTYLQATASTTDISASNYLDVNGATTLDGTLTVAGLSILNGNLITEYAAGTYDLGKFYVDGSGNVSASGTLSVVGASTLTGAVTITGAGTLSSTLAVTGTSTLANALIVDYVASTYNQGKFFVDTSGNVSASGTLAIVGTTALTGATSITGNLAVDTNTLLVNASTNKVGVVSTTPMAQLSVGAGLGVTSTIATGKFCMYAGQENGTMVYLILGNNQPANQPFATTTASCF